MTCKTAASALILILTHVCVARSEPVPCAVRVKLATGWACGARRTSQNGTEFAGFLGIPYAKQPVGELRFQELQPAEPWDYMFDATKEGPVCPQRDVFYGRLMHPSNTELTEACIHANVFAPLHALERPLDRPARGLQPPYRTGHNDDLTDSPGLPILVFVHGGGFGFGSGDPDVYGPEYLVPEGVIVITFNYRLNVFGFLSLNNSYIPGNNGLRDIVTLLRWVQTNARAFGGNPDDVTLAGHSAGAASAHILSLTDVTKGLFKRILLMSGTALPTFYTTSTAYAQYVSNMFLNNLGINASDPEEKVHRQLIEMPLKKIMEVHTSMQDLFGLTVFNPVVETPFPNFTTILSDDPGALIVRGEGKDIPLIIGFTDAECYGFLPRFEQIDILARVKENPILLAPIDLIYKRPKEVALDIAKRVRARYFGDELTMDQYMKSCSDSYFIYPAMKVALLRAAAGGAPVFLYEFAYNAEVSIKKLVDGADYRGAGHLEDVTNVFRANSVLGPDSDIEPTRNDDDLRNWMVHFVRNFARCSDPACNRERRPHFATPWPPFTKLFMMYQGINMPFYRTLELNSKQLDTVRFFDSLQNRTS